MSYILDVILMLISDVILMHMLDVLVRMHTVDVLLLLLLLLLLLPVTQSCFGKCTVVTTVLKHKYAK